MNTTKSIYSGKDKAFPRELNNLQKERIHPDSKKLIIAFHNHLYSQNIGQLRIAKLSAQLRNICRWIEQGCKHNIGLPHLTKTHATDVIAYINRINRADNTKADYRRCIKQFYRWYQEEDPRLDSTIKEKRQEAKKLYKYLEKDVRIGYKLPQADPNTILTEQDIQTVIELGARTPREKAIISTLHETGLRSGEFLTLKIGDLNHKENHTEVHVPDGKTGRRVVYIVKSLPYLLNYLQCHPHKNNNNAPLWVAEAHCNAGQALSHKACTDLVNNAFTRAKVRKRHNLHWFRHSRASLLAPEVTEAVLCKIMGWTIGSRQVKTYAHLSVKQIEHAILSLHGYAKKEEKTSEPVRCGCGMLNQDEARYCMRCSKPLNVSTAVQDAELVNSEVNKTVQFLMEIAKNPALLAQFETFKKLAKKERL